MVRRPARVLSKLIFLNRHFHPEQSASGQLLSDLTLHCVDEGWDVHVISGGPSAQPLTDDLAEVESVCGVTVHRVDHAGPDNSFQSRARQKLGALIAAGDLVVAMSDPPLASAMAAEVAIPARARLINWVQDVYPEGMLALGWLCRVRGCSGGCATLPSALPPPTSPSAG